MTDNYLSIVRFSFRNFVDIIWIRRLWDTILLRIVWQWLKLWTQTTLRYKVTTFVCYSERNRIIFLQMMKNNMHDDIQMVYSEPYTYIYSKYIFWEYIYTLYHHNRWIKLFYYKEHTITIIVKIILECHDILKCKANGSTYTKYL